MRYLGMLVWLAAATALVGCEPGPTAHIWGAAVPSVADEPATASSATGHSQPTVTNGHFHAVAQVAAWNGRGWVDLGGASAIVVALQDDLGADQLNGGASVPAGTYSRVRLTLSDAEVRGRGVAAAGGAAQPGPATVRVGDGGEFTIVREIEPVLVTGGIRVRLVFDLNSDRWLDGAAAREGWVPDAAVRQATTVRRQVEPR